MDPTSLDKIRQVNADKADLAQKELMHNQQLDSAASLQRVLLSSFQALVNVMEHNGDKQEAVQLIASAFDRLDRSIGEGHADIGDIKALLGHLEAKISAIPTDPLKDMPNFPEHPGTVEVSNLEGVESALKSLETAVKGQKTTVKAPDVHVDAPKVNVPAPNVHVDAPDMEPVRSAVAEVKTAISKWKFPDVQKTEQQNTLISEKFDEYKLVYKESLDEDAPLVISGINYFYKGKKVAGLKYNYDKENNLTGVKRT